LTKFTEITINLTPKRKNDIFGIAEMGTEKCPFCGQEIDSAAIRCFFCGAELSKESVHERLKQLHEKDIQHARGIRKPVAAGIIVVIILIYIIFFYDTSGKKRIPVIDNPSQSLTVRLNAKVTFPGERFVVYNNDSFDWYNVRLEIMPESTEYWFGLKVPIISAGQTYTATAAEFSREDGTRFNPDKMKPKEFRILCETPNKVNGSYQADIK
jgi:uncharacterized protein (UPF0212 family)